MRPLGVSRGLLRSRGVSWGLMRHHGVSQDFTVSHVLLLIKKPRLEVVSIETVETAGTIGDKHALDGTCGTSVGPHLGPPLQGALADGERLLGGDDQRFLNCDRSILANLDCVSRGLVRPVRVLRWHEAILATRGAREVAYPHNEARAMHGHHPSRSPCPRSRSRSLLVGVTARGVSPASCRSGISEETGTAYGVAEHMLGRLCRGGAIWFDMAIENLPCSLPYKKASVPPL